MHAQTVSPFGSFACGKISFALRLNCKNAQEEVKWKRSITYPLRKRRERLKAQEMERLKSFFRGNPAIELAYEFKEKLCKLLNKKSQMAKQCSKNIRKLKEMMKAMGYETPTTFGVDPGQRSPLSVCLSGLESGAQGGTRTLMP